MFHVRSVLMVAMISAAGLLPFGRSARADGISQSAIAQAQEFLDKQSTGEFVLGYAHLGTQYSRHSLKSVNNVTDSSGELIPGEFALIYRFDWVSNGAGWTNLAFFCDREGYIEKVVPLQTNATLQQPFLFADATIQTLGSVIIEAFKDEMTDSDLRNMRRLVAEADSKGLLGLALRLRQALGG